MTSFSLINGAVLLSVISSLSLSQAAPTAENSHSKRTTYFVNVHGGADSTGCTDDNFAVALGTNDDSQPSGPENCVLHNSQAELPADFQNELGGWEVWFDAQLASENQLFIVRSPAGTDMDGCGVTVRVADAPGCYFNTLASTFLLQYCIGGTCDGGVGLAESNVTARTVDASSHADVERAVAELSENEGSGIVNIHVDKRTASRHSLEALGIHSRQDASCWNKGDSYTKLGADSEVRVLGDNQVCPGPESCAKTYEHSESVSNSISAELSAGIEGIFSLTFGFEHTEEQSSSNTDQFNLPPGGVGKVTWTPIYRCFSGEFSGCENGDPADGSSAEMCTADKDGNGNVRGVLSFVSLAKGPPQA